jgi:integrase
MFTVLRTSLKYAVKIRLLEYPPTVGVGRPQTVEREMLYLHTPEQVEPLARGFPDRYYTLIYFAAFTGMRFGEIAGLTIKRLDLMRSHVYVEDTLTDIDGTLTWGTPKSKKGRRNFSLPEDLRDMLVAHIAEFVDDPTDRDSLVFTSARGPRSHERQQAFTGSPLRASGFNKPWKRTVPKVLPPELHGLRFHDLRHTCAALMIANGEEPLTISRQLGHASISITMDVYGHLMPEVSLEAARGLNNMLRRARGTTEPGAEDVG